MSACRHTRALLVLHTILLRRVRLECSAYFRCLLSSIAGCGQRLAVYRIQRALHEQNESTERPQKDSTKMRKFTQPDKKYARAHQFRKYR